MECPACQSLNPDSSRFCGECGGSLGAPAQATAPCHACGHVFPAAQKFCGECGQKRTRARAASAPPPRVVPEAAISELKIVTVLFSDMCGFTSLSEKLDTEELRDLMNGWFDRLSKLIPSFGGTIDKFIGDAVMALFGAPVAHDNDPKRAIDAALAMQAELEEYNREVGHRIGEPMRIRIGINTGRVYAGMLGGDSHKSYTVMGDAVNVASRLESACPIGSILVSESTLDHVPGVYDVKTQEPLRVKGKAEPLTTFEILGRRRPSERSESNEDAVVALSRAEELVNAAELYEHAVSSKSPQLLVVTADAGMAKNQFSSCLAHRLDGTNLGASLSTFCDAGVGSAPFQVLIDFLSQAGGDSEELEAHLRACSLSAEAFRVLRHLMRLPVGPQGPPATLGDPSALQHATLEASVEWLRSLASKGPIVLRIHNLHYAPDATLDLLSHWLDREAIPLLVVTTANRSIEEEGGYWAPLLARSARITLGALSPDAARAVASHILSPLAPPSPELVERIAEASGGNPGFMEESVRSLLATGVLIETDCWVLKDGEIPSPLPIPDTVGRMIQVRVDRLSPAGKLVLQRAAVIGPRFDAEELSALEDEEAPRGRAVIEDVLEEAVKAGLLSVHSREHGRPSEYRFRPAMVRDEVYETVVAKQRRVWHERYAASLRTHAEVALSSPRAVTLEDLAAHVLRSGNNLEAAMLYKRAGDAAAAVYANSDARRQYEAASAALKDSAACTAERSDVLQLLGRMLALNGEHARAQDTFAEAIELLGNEQAAKRAALEVERGRSFAASGKRDLARQSYMQAVLLVTGNAEATATATLADAQQNLGWLNYLESDVDGAEALFHAALETLGDESAPLVRARCYDSLGFVERLRGNVGGAIASMRTALETRRACNDKASVATSCINLGAVHFDSGDYEAAGDLFLEALKLHEQRGNLDGVANAYVNLGAAELELGSLEQAVEHLATGTEVASTLGAWYLPECYRYRAEAALREGNIDDARRYAETGLAKLGTDGFVEFRGNLASVLGAIELAANRIDAAKRHLDEAMRAHEESQNKSELAVIKSRLSRLSLACDDKPAARAFLAEARELFEKASNTTMVERTDRALAAID